MSIQAFMGYGLDRRRGRRRVSPFSPPAEDAPRHCAKGGEIPMPINRMDHFTILTTNTEKTVAFYNDMLGFAPGPRPAFSFPGAWLYNDGKAVLHVVERSSIPEGGGVLDHIAFFGTDPSAYVAKLKARGMKYDLRRLPQPGHAEGLWQLFFFDPSGARVEIDFAASETVDGQG
jgi:catechol 2,3-dioxygenase-like lactoylglutathione lyase family enzyme